MSESASDSMSDSGTDYSDDSESALLKGGGGGGTESDYSESEEDDEGGGGGGEGEEEDGSEWTDASSDSSTDGEADDDDDDMGWDEEEIEMQRWLKMLNIYRDDLQKFKADLAKGMDIIKHGRSGAEKMRTIFSEDMGATVSWVVQGKSTLSPDPGKTFAIEDVVEIKCGLGTAPLKRTGKLMKSNVSFGLVLPKKRTFNIEALDFASYRKLIIGFKLLKAESLYRAPPKSEPEKGKGGGDDKAVVPKAGAAARKAVI
jgi:hypothetical protein